MGRFLKCVIMASVFPIPFEWLVLHSHLLLSASNRLRWQPAARVPPHHPQGDAAMSRRPCACLLVLLAAWPVAAADAPAKVRHKLYVTNSAGDDVTVIDVASNRPIGRIEVGPHP